jgi:hypothetical protein
MSLFLPFPPTRFDVEPYVGALPIRFGMARPEVHNLLGPPKRSFPIWDGSGTSDHYWPERFTVGYDNAGMVKHVGFSPGGVELLIQGQVIWTLTDQPDPNPILLALDPDPVESVGIWVFLRIGVTTAGYHDNDRSQRAFTVFPHDTWSVATQPANTSRYRIKR